MLSIEQKAETLRDNLSRLCPTAPTEVDLQLVVWGDLNENLERARLKVPVGRHDLVRMVADYNLRHRLYKEHENHAFQFEFSEGGFEGYIDSDGRVNVRKAGVAVAYLWRVVTDIGQDRRLESVDSTEAVGWMQGYIREFYERYGTDAYYGREARSFLDGIKQHYKYEVHSRLSLIHI